MLDNLKLVPGEAFIASDHIIEKVIDKLSDIVGWCFAPKGVKAYQIEAEKYLIDKIKGDSNMPEMAKAACISNIRKVIREYRNQENILLLALKFLNNAAAPDDVDDDWLKYFFDNAKNINNENMAIIWGHILAKEINEPNKIPKSLIYILSVIDYEDATSFKKLANVTLQIGDIFVPIVFTNNKDIYEKWGLTTGDIISLENTSLIQHSELLYNYKINPADKITYFDENICVENVEEICIGQVILSKAGQALMSVITDRTKLDGFAEFAQKTIIKADGGIFDNIFSDS